MSFLQRAADRYARVMRTLVMALAAVTNISILAMMLITCADILLRLFGRPIIGAYDLVRLSGAVAMACALPYVTAVKGHVAIEYFFQKLRLAKRNLVDRVLNTVAITLFCLLGNESLRVGARLKLRGEVTATLQLPIFWVLWLIGACCFLTAMVIVFNLLQPRKEMIRP